MTVRILLVTSADETIGGVPYVIGNLARHLNRQGHEVIFLYSGTTLCPRKRKTKWGFNGFDLNLQMPFGDRHPIISLPLFLLRFPVGLFQLIRLMQKYRIQIVNIHYPTECFFYFSVCRQILPIKLITSVHGADLFPGGRSLTVYPKAMIRLLDLADRVVTPSRAYAEDVSRVFPQLRDKLVSIHNGVDIAELTGCSSNSASIPLPYILCVAMHNEKKGIDVLLRAFKLIHDKKPSLKLVLAGDGPLHEQLKQLAYDLGVSDKVVFLGILGRRDVADLLRGCELFVLPSRSEPFGIVLIEAMASKKPVVATTAGGIPEIINDGMNGILVTPDDHRALAEALLTVLQDVNLQNRLAENGHATLRHRFRIEHTCSAYESLFYNLLASSEKDFRKERE